MLKCILSAFSRNPNKTHLSRTQATFFFKKKRFLIWFLEGNLVFREIFFLYSSLLSFSSLMFFQDGVGERVPLRGPGALRSVRLQAQGCPLRPRSAGLVRSPQPTACSSLAPTAPHSLSCAAPREPAGWRGLGSPRVRRGCAGSGRSQLRAVRLFPCQRSCFIRFTLFLFFYLELYTFTK